MTLVPTLKADPPPNSKKPVTVRAVHASAAVGAWYFAELERFTERMRADVSRAVLSAYGALEPQSHADPSADPIDRG